MRLIILRIDLFNCGGIVRFERKGRDAKQVSVYPKEEVAAQ